MLALKDAQEIASAALTYATSRQLMPLSVVVLDQRGVLKVAGTQDGASLARPDIALAKANGALSMGMGSRDLAKAAINAPHFIQSLSTTIRGGIVPHLGGVLIRNADGQLLGAVGISGDRGDRDEAAAIHGVQTAGFVADAGASE
ncbi:heme-binding protein [Rhizobium sp. BK060]|uniref:GlcG/HbpS family heme-binding protein n=1 Tax=Rhizobium sp. BK060 TaxID=2587096 RepID=UPI0016077ABC|nr:heme-binding protein [Rhizobium sp. BK060]MBB3396016.1 uncharacterized protein GlcG (DUF336 family) [Rhizobium sp. BK060]